VDNKIFKIGTTRKIPSQLFRDLQKINNRPRKINDATEYNNNKIPNNKTIFLFLTHHNRTEITIRQILKKKKEDIE
jgi:hypothetical protein